MSNTVLMSDNGDIVFLDNVKMYDVYVLFLNLKPIYVGCSTNIEQRILTHKADKEFDSYCVYNSFYSKMEALRTERQVTYVLSHIGGIELLNVSGTTKTKHIKGIKRINV